MHRQRLSPLLQLLHGGGDLIGLLLQTADHVVLLLHLIIRCLAHSSQGLVLAVAVFARWEGSRNPFWALRLTTGAQRPVCPTCVGLIPASSGTFPR